MIMFGFEVDTLEVALRGQLEYLDKIFIVESTLNQKGVTITVTSSYPSTSFTFRNQSHCCGRG